MVSRITLLVVIMCLSIGLIGCTTKPNSGQSIQNNIKSSEPITADNSDQQHFEAEKPVVKPYVPPIEVQSDSDPFESSQRANPTQNTQIEEKQDTSTKTPLGDTKDCRLCNGTGKVRTPPCWGCSGTGKDIVGETCQLCGGSGKSSQESTMACPDCFGFGQLLRCNLCLGMGYLPENKECPKCRGKGWRKKPMLDRNQLQIV